jgi:hypothetical protein
MAKKATRKAASRKAAKGSARRRQTGRKGSAAPKRRSGTKKSAAKRAAGRKTASRKTAPRKVAARKSTSASGTRKTTTSRSTASRAATPKRPSRGRVGGNGRESTLDQTPETGRSVQGRTNPMPTKRSTGTAAGAGDTRRAPGLERERKRLREVEETVPGPPSSLNMERHGSAARSGRAALRHAKHEHTAASPALTGGDVDADWEDAYAVGDEAPGGDNPTPDQDRVDDIGRALGIEYADNEELKAADKIIERDRHRWELDPASAEDYPDHDDE